jgi:two-component system, LuxR family, sensor kinase FixL
MNSSSASEVHAPPDALHVLLIEDDADTRANLADILELDGHRLTGASTFSQACELAAWDDVGTVILDWQLPDGNAGEFLPHIHALAPQAPVVVVTGHPDVNHAIQALRRGAYDFILKPINPDMLRATLARVARHLHTERALRRSEEQRQLLAAAVRNLAEGVIITDADLIAPGPRILFANDAIRRITGYEVDELIGRSPRLLQGEATDRAALQRLKTALTKGHTFKGEFINYRKDRTPYHVEVLISPVRDDKQRITHFVAAHRDITDLKRAEERAVQAARLAAIGQMVAGLAHESRNALQRSQACLEMLAMEVEDRPDLLDLVARVQRAQDDLHRLYEEVRDYASPRRLQREPCDIAHVWRDTWSHLKFQHEAKRLQFQATSTCASRFCDADPFALGQVFRNVLENAIAASPAESEITLKCEDVALENRPAIRVSVRDRGPGIPLEVRERVFEPFFTTKTKGTGLGMAIAKRIVEEHGGRIFVSDAEGPGAEIVILLPREAV